MSRLLFSRCFPFSDLLLKMSGDSIKSLSVKRLSETTMSDDTNDSTKKQKVKVSWLPDGYHSVTPYLCIKNCIEAIKFYETAFGAKEIYRLVDDSAPTVIQHAELQIGDSRFMVSEEMIEWGNKSPTTIGGSGTAIYIFSENCDATFKQAVGAGAKAMAPPMDMFFGDRCGTVVDPYGHKWTIATHVEDVSDAEMAIRARNKFGHGTEIASEVEPSQVVKTGSEEESAKNRPKLDFQKEGFYTLTPGLAIKNCPEALEWYKKAFNAFEINRITSDDETQVYYSQIQIGTSSVTMSEEMPKFDHISPATLGGSPVSLSIYVEDCDKIFNQAIEAGAKLEKPLADQFYGDRTGSLLDPFGHKWTIVTHIEDVTPQEMKRRMAAFTAPTTAADATSIASTTIPIA